jgi:hypothetical protein
LDHSAPYPLSVGPMVSQADSGEEAHFPKMVF